MPDPFGPPAMFGQPNGPNQRQQNNNNNSNSNRSNQMSLRNQNNGNQFDPFGHSMFHDMHHGSLMAQHHQAMANPFALMNQMMSGGFSNNVFNQMDQFGKDPNTQVYSSSSVMTYSNTGDGKPKIYQASSQMRQAPGGVKETRKMVRDSEKGIEKVALGHHIGDRAHVIERQKFNDGPVEEIVNLENLDDVEVNDFNKEFETKIRSHHHTGHHRAHIGGNQPFALEDGRSNKKDKEHRHKSKSKNKH